jgi:hypothetical protein
VPAAVFTGALSGAMQMLTDNSGILLYVLGIPLFLIAVSVLIGWIKAIRRAH